MCSLSTSLEANGFQEMRLTPIKRRLHCGRLSDPVRD